MNKLIFDIQRFESVHREGNMIYGTSGGDNINNGDSGVEIHSGKGYDYINNSGSNVYISAGDEDANVTNTGDNTTVIAGTHGTINNRGENSVLYGGSITNSGARSHLIGSTEGENLKNYGNRSTISASDGNATVTIICTTPENIRNFTVKAAKIPY